MFIAEAIASAVDQECEYLEVVVSDDGSSDNTVDIILDYADRYPKRVVPLVDGLHLGITGNSNRALHACRGKYIALGAGDDIFLPGKIAKQIAWLEADERRVLCGHDVDVFESTTNKTHTIFRTPQRLRFGVGASAFVRYGVVMLGQSIMLRASAIPINGYDLRLSTVSDWKLWIDTLASGGQYGYIDGIYSRYRRHNKSITRDTHSFITLMTEWSMMISLVEIEHPHLLLDCRYARAKLYADIGVSYIRLDEVSKAQTYLFASMLYALSLKSIVAPLIAYLPVSLRHWLLARLARYR
jgi:glycosyltransferase involved in cell wall biosynthesis